MEFVTSPGLVAYPAALSAMESHVQAMIEGRAEERIWFLEHPPLYTAGTSARAEDLLHPQFPVYETGRGGQYTYHGPGQRVVYTMLDLKRHYPVPDVRQFVRDLEDVIIRALDDLGVDGQRREGRVGIWVRDEKTGADAKVAALGIRIRHGISFHGIAINVAPNLDHFQGIVPCGIRDSGVTSLEKMGKGASFYELDRSLRRYFEYIFR